MAYLFKFGKLNFWGFFTKLGANKISSHYSDTGVIRPAAYHCKRTTSLIFRKKNTGDDSQNEKIKSS